MQQDIQLTGVTLTPYSDVSQDGQLSVSHGVEMYNGSLRPSVVTGPVYQLNSLADGVIKYIHATGSFRHIVYIKSDGTVMYFDQENDESHNVTNGTILTDDISVDDVDIIGSGNILVINRKEMKPYYTMWNGVGYNDMGEIPELHASFSLSGNLQIRELESYSGGWSTNPTTEDEQMKNYNIAAAAVSNFVNEECNKRGCFVHPFFVRAAYRLYDGTHILHTPPVLMLPNTDGPIISATYEKDKIVAIGFSMKLGWEINHIDKKWHGIISGIDIFVSLPLDPFEYNFDKENPHIFERGAQRNFSIGRCKSHKYVIMQSNNEYTYQRHLFDFSKLNGAGYGRIATLQYKKDYIVNNEDNSNFYLLHHISGNDIDDISTDEFTMPKDYYSNLAFKDRLTDDFDSHDVRYPYISHVYNRRLSVVSEKTDHFAGHELRELFAKQDYLDPTDRSQYSLYFLTSRNGLEQWHYMGTTQVGGYFSYLNYLYNPSSAVKEFCVKKVDRDGKVKYAKYKMHGHRLLNGVQFYFDWNKYDFAYETRGVFENVFSDYYPSEKVYDDTLVLEEDNPKDIETNANVLRTSQVNNPFFFPVEGTNTIGTGRIIAVSSVTEPLSQGQFGGFPLMALCTDGNYALKVLANGLYGEPSPMKRDVCINASSVMPIDGAIIFTSAQGVMLCNGNDIQCISKDLSGVADKFASDIANDNFDDNSDIITKPTSKLADLVYAWDYTEQRIIAFVPGSRYILLRESDGTWSSSTITDTDSRPVRVINQYPYSLIQFADSEFMFIDYAYDFASSKIHDYLVITRPMKLGTYQLKRLQQFAMQCIIGSEASSHTIELYASQDCVNWTKIGTTSRLRVTSMKGRWYKYIRFVISGKLKHDENISSLRLTYDVRNESAIR